MMNETSGRIAADGSLERAQTLILFPQSNVQVSLRATDGVTGTEFSHCEARSSWEICSLNKDNDATAKN